MTITVSAIAPMALGASQQRPEDAPARHTMRSASSERIGGPLDPVHRREAASFSFGFKPRQDIAERDAPSSIDGRACATMGGVDDVLTANRRTSAKVG